MPRSIPGPSLQAPELQVPHLSADALAWPLLTGTPPSFFLCQPITGMFPPLGVLPAPGDPTWVSLADPHSTTPSGYGLFTTISLLLE